MAAQAVEEFQELHPELAELFRAGESVLGVSEVVMCNVHTQKAGVVVLW
jgi:hypothetical protein